jgi:hypothetical protein
MVAAGRDGVDAAEAASGNMAKMMYGAKEDEVGNGGDYVKA